MLEASDTDRAVLGLCDSQHFGALSSLLVDRCAIEQVTQIVAIELQKLDLDAELAEFRLLPPVLNLCEQEVEHSRHDSNLIEGESDCASRSHRVSLSTTSLPIGQDGRVVTLETA